MWVRSTAITTGSSMQAMILTWPPQLLQVSMSISKTRCRRGAQVMAAGHSADVVSLGAAGPANRTFKAPFRLPRLRRRGTEWSLGRAWIAHRCNGWTGVGVDLLTTSVPPSTDTLQAQIDARALSRQVVAPRIIHISSSRARRRTSLQPSIQAYMLEDACNDTWICNGVNHLQFTATMGALAQVNCEYPLQADHPTHRRGARLRRRFIVGGRLARYLATRHDGRSIAGIAHGCGR
jgi:hypothetical protein